MLQKLCCPVQGKSRINNNFINVNNNCSIENPDEKWIIEKYSNAVYYTIYSRKSKGRIKAWFRVCPDDLRKSYNDSNRSSYNLIFRLHGTRSDDMTKEHYSFYHSRFIELIVCNLLDEIRELSITVSAKDIEGLDRIKNYDWR